MSRDLFGCEIKELCKIDEKVKTWNEEMTNWDLCAADILKGPPDDDEDIEDIVNIICVAELADFLC